MGINLSVIYFVSSRDRVVNVNVVLLKKGSQIVDTG